MSTPRGADSSDGKSLREGVPSGEGIVRDFASGRPTESKPRKPAFFVIGPPRTGTSWLHTVLSRHVLLPSPTKETRFFDTHFHRGIDWYRAHYPNLNEDRLLGEVAPTYFASADARSRIATNFPDAKIVCIFRNPVERVVSLYRIKRAYGMISCGFEQALAEDPELMESSRYSSNLKAWQLAFGKEQILPTVYDDLRNEPQRYIDRLADFIGIPRFALSASQVRFVHSSEFMTHPRNFYWTKGATALADWFKARRLDRVVAAVKSSPLLKLFLGGGQAFSDLSPEFSKRLYEQFRPEVDSLEEMLDRDLSAWKAPAGDGIESILSSIRAEEEISKAAL